MMPNDVVHIRIPDSESILRRAYMWKQKALASSDGKREWRKFEVYLTEGAVYFYDNELKIVSDVLPLVEIIQGGVIKADDAPVDIEEKTRIDKLLLRSRSWLPLSSTKAEATFNPEGSLVSGLSMLQKHDDGDKSLCFNLHTRPEGKQTCTQLCVHEHGELTNLIFRPKERKDLSSQCD